MNKLQIAINEANETRMRLDMATADAFLAKQEYIANECTENFERLKEAWKIVHDVEQFYYITKYRLEAHKIIDKYERTKKASGGR